MNEQYKMQETLELNYNGVLVYLRLDYEAGTASFVEKSGNPNKFRFTDRTVEYLGGWVEVFRALEKATILADKLLREQQELRETTKTQKTIDLMIAISDLKSAK